jgi:hypothetical protein
MYKRYIYNVLIVTIPVSILLYLIALFSFRTGEVIWVDEMIKRKTACIEKSAPRRIIFGGGSNALYGINTVKIEKTVHVPVCNIAMHAGLGMHFITTETRKFLKSGDLLIMPLEYELMLQSTSDSKLTFDYYRIKDPRKLLGFEPIEIFINSITMNLFDSLMESVSLPGQHKTIRDAFKVMVNENGDMIMKEGNRPGRINPFDIPPQGFYETRGLIFLSELNKWCYENNISLYVTFPNTIFLNNYETPRYKEFFRNLTDYFKKNNIRYLGSPYDAFYPEELFYDSAYHMNKKGSDLRTEKMIKLMRENKLLDF